MQLSIEFDGHRRSSEWHHHCHPQEGWPAHFGTEAEEKGFSTTQGTFDTTGILYARTVFDPLAIIDAAGNVQPYLAQSIVPNADYTVWTSPCDPTSSSTMAPLATAPRSPRTSPSSRPRA